MINSLNSNHFNLNLQNKNLNPKESNVSKSSSENFTKELSQETLINASNSILNSVNDKTQAVSKILGYGVDKDGFFTSDFNEAAGLPKDYKINANWIEDFNQILTTTKLSSKALYNYVDWAKELGNFYKENLQSFDKLGENFNKEEIDKEFNITLKDGFAKNDVLQELFTSKGLKMKEAKSSLYGKTYGFDSNIKQKDMNEFYAFMQKNQLKDANKIEKSSFKNIMGDTWMGIDRERSKLQTYISYAVSFHLDGSLVQKAKDFENEFDELMSEDLSLDEFETKYMDFKQRHDEFVKEFETAMGDNLLVKPIDENFKPLQAESKNKETYKDNDTRNELVKKILEAKFSTSKELELLLGVKISDDENFSNFLLKKKLQNKSVDIRV
ncbi:Cj0814 family flagellar-dependent secreted protein [Campylobacter sp. VTCC 70190]|uniref:Cj0814 family flagellar-dependent secreted protein n=1 Tax=Campylobacter sp. VTCC 70190 TaxID=3392118 RepID=UPI00398E3CE5